MRLTPRGRAVALVSALLVGWGGAHAFVSSAQALPEHEDQPGWDCRVQGNRACGVTFEDGSTVVVHHDAEGTPVLVTTR